MFFPSTKVNFSLLLPETCISSYPSLHLEFGRPTLNGYTTFFFFMPFSDTVFQTGDTFPLKFTWNKQNNNAVSNYLKTDRSNAILLQNSKQLTTKVTQLLSTTKLSLNRKTIASNQPSTIKICL